MEEETEAITKQLPVSVDTETPYDDITDQPEPVAISPHPSIDGCPEIDMDDDCVIINEDVVKSVHAVDEPVNLDRLSQLITKVDEVEDVELQAMFYIPEWSSAPPPSTSKPCKGRDESLKVILANVAELLSRSPPPLTEDLEADVAAPSLPPSPLRPQQPFQVTFNLDVEDDDDDKVMISHASSASPDADSDVPPLCKEAIKICHDHQQESVSRGSAAAESPSWDEVFGEEEAIDNHDVRDQNKETDDEEEKSENEGMIEAKGSCWDDVRNEDMPDLIDDGVTEERDPQIDDSMDLFGDDEAFLQMTIPDISTPGVTPRKSPGFADTTSATKTTSNTSHMRTPTTSRSTAHTAEDAHRLNTNDLAQTKHTNLTPQDTNNHSAAETKHSTHMAAANKHATDNSKAGHCKSPTVHQSESFDDSRDFFSVNFDLGYSLDDSEEEEVEEVPAPCTSTSPQSKKQTASHSSTPCNSFHRPRIPPQSSEPKLSTPQMLSEYRKREMSSLPISPLTSKGGALPSPITSPGPRRTLMPGYAGPRTPSLRSSLKRRRLGGGAAEAERVSGVGNGSHQESVCAADSPTHAGLFFRLKIRVRK